MTEGKTNDTLRELAMRLLALPYPFENEAPKPRFWVGKLPEDLLVPLPVPEGSRVIGSFARNDKHFQIVLDVNLSPEAVLEFYCSHFLIRGWNEPPRHHFGGFTFGQQHNVVLCGGRRGPELQVNAWPTEDNLTDVRLSLQLDATHSPCGNPPTLGRPQVIPELGAPPKARSMGGGAGGGGNAVYSDATLETDLDVAGILDFYKPWLQKAGWALKSERRSDFACVSEWALNDSEGLDWGGLLLVAAVALLFDRMNRIDRRVESRQLEVKESRYGRSSTDFETCAGGEVRRFDPRICRGV